MTIPAKQRDVLRRIAEHAHGAQGRAHVVWRSFVGVALTCALSILASASLGATTAQSSQFKRCADVVFNSMPGGRRAINVRTSGVSCTKARRLVKQRHRRGCSEDAFCRTWRCRTTGRSTPKPLTDCRRPSARVVWNDVGGS